MTAEEAKSKICETFALKNELAYREFINLHYQSLPRQVKIDRADESQDVVVYEEYVLKLQSEVKEDLDNDPNDDEHIPSSLRSQMGQQTVNTEQPSQESKKLVGGEVSPMLQLVFEDAAKELKVIEEYLSGGEDITLNSKTLLFVDKPDGTKAIVGMEYLDRIIIFSHKETIPEECLGEDIPISKDRIVHFDNEGNVSITTGGKKKKNEE